MGVSLGELVQSKEISFSDLSGKSIAIDAYNVCYQFLSIIRDRFTGEPLRDSSGNITSHLSGLFYRTARILESGITPIYIFDGEPPDFKKATVKLRIKVRKEAEVKWKEALKKGDIEKVRTYSQAAIRFTKDMVEESKELLESMGVAWVQAPSEGEAQATYYVRRGKVWACGSQDWDSLLFGAERLVRNLTVSGRRKVPRKEKYIEVNPELVELKRVLEQLDISQDQLIILGILVGTDYNPGGVKGIGPKTALKLVKEYKTMKGIMENVKWEFDIPADKILDFFKNPPTKDIKIEKHKINPEKLKEILVEKHDFSEDRIGSIIKKLVGSVESKKQTGLGKFF